MFRLRAKVFHERLGWDVRVVDGRERDRFDALDPCYLIAHQGGRVLGCVRLLPTTGPNMLRDVFPQLVGAAGIPCGERIWEASRFAVSGATIAGGHGFSRLPAAMVGEVVLFAARQGLDAIVGVTGIAFERMLLKQSITLARLGPPRRIGDVTSLAFRLPITPGNITAALDARMRLDVETGLLHHMGSPGDPGASMVAAGTPSRHQATATP